MHRRFQHLLKLQLIPSDDFMFLTGVEPCGEGELRWYDDPLRRGAELALTQAELPAATQGGFSH
jgi:hypothetical protein